MSVIRGLCSPALVLLVVACSSKSPEPAAPAGQATQASAHEDGIAWRTDVDAAFAEAKTSNKPVFLYWGAVWCPPCQQVRSTIFKRPEFIERTRLVIPVYLDGDSPSAQAYADRFGVIGYPTVVILSADGTEITRLPGGADADLYMSVLDAAISNLKPVKDLIATAGEDAKKLTPADWHVLAYYAWDVDAGRVVDPKQAATVVWRLFSSCRPPAAAGDCLRLELTLAALTAAEKDKPTAAIDRAHLQATLIDLLDSSSLQRQNLDYLIYHSDDLVSVSTKKGTKEH
ncbi:MAG: thioredoxin family protein, partial [Steroidobacteraceae bacterium]